MRQKFGFRKLLLWIWRKDALFSQDCVSWTFVDLTWKYFFSVVCYRNGIRLFTMQLPMGEQMWHLFFSKLKRMSKGGIVGWEVLDLTSSHLHPSFSMLSAWCPDPSHASSSIRPPWDGAHSPGSGGSYRCWVRSKRRTLSLSVSRTLNCWSFRDGHCY